MLTARARHGSSLTPSPPPPPPPPLQVLPPPQIPSPTVRLQRLHAHRHSRYDTCQLRYSDESFSLFRNDRNFLYPAGMNANDPDTFSKNEGVLMRNLSYQTAHNSNSLMFAMGEMLVYESSDQPTIYGLVQCTRDLSADVCSQCLQQLLVFFQCCYSETEGGILGESCSFRYGVRNSLKRILKFPLLGCLRRQRLLLLFCSRLRLL